MTTDVKDFSVQIAGRIWNSPALSQDMDRLCGFGGRFCGTDSERLARDYLADRLKASGAEGVRFHEFAYDGWSRGETRLEILDPEPLELPAWALVQSPSTPPEGMTLEVLDLGRGGSEDFAIRERGIASRCVLVNHEYPFSTSHIHRRVKYTSAVKAGATAFLIASPLPGNLLVSGSSGPGRPGEIPGVGISLESACLLRRLLNQGPVRVRLRMQHTLRPAQAANVLAEIPGRGPEVVVVSAHYDGHDLAQSALDNASGTAVALELARAFAPLAGKLPRGIRIALFTVEEWGLKGSARYVDGLSVEERRAIAFVLNMDSVVGNGTISFLTGGFPELSPFLRATANAVGVEVKTIDRLMANSDHFNFALRGIPAVRMVSGFDDAEASTRFLLTPADTRDKVDDGDLKLAALVAGQIAVAAVCHDGPIARHRSESEIEALMPPRV